MSVSGIRTAALSLAILAIVTEWTAIATRLSRLGRNLDPLHPPSVVVLGALAGLALAACRPTRR